MTKGSFNEDIVFSVEFFDNSIYKKEDFRYFWTIPKLEPTKYLNTRFESKLKIKFLDLNNILDVIIVELTQISDLRKFTKEFPFKSIELPSVKCNIQPETGISGITTFRITALNSISKNTPLKYSFYYKNDLNIDFLISDFYDTSFTTLLPSGTNFFLKVTDKLGFIATTDCFVQVEKNENLINLKSKLMSQEEKFLESEIIYSNMKGKISISIDYFRFQDSMNFLSTLFAANRNLFIDSNIERIISLITILNSCNKDLEVKENLIKFYDLLEKISQKIQPIAKNKVLTENFAKVVDLTLSKFYIDNSESSNVQILKKNDFIWNNIIKSVHDQLISGEDYVLKTDINRIAISKISKINLSTIRLLSNVDQGREIQRIISSSEIDSNTQEGQATKEDCSYTIDSDICIEKSEIIQKINNSSRNDIGIFVKVMNSPYIPNQSRESYLLSLNSVKVSVIEDSPTYLRLLNDLILSNITNSTAFNNTYYEQLQYKSYLNLNSDIDQSKLKKDIQGSTCVLYDENYILNATACKSWFDVNARLVLCECSKRGLVVNLYNQDLTSLSRDSQFKRPGFGYCKILFS